MIDMVKKGDMCLSGLREYPLGGLLAVINPFTTSDWAWKYS